MSFFKPHKTSIVKDATWLQPLSDPPGARPLCRETYLQTMADYLSELFKTGQAKNLFICGKPGTGKTVCVNYLLKEINKHSSETKSNILTVYVNAGKTRTPYFTMVEILRGFGMNVPAAGWQMFRLKQAFEQLLKTNSVLIAIDEVDGIIYKEKEPLVYYLNRQTKTTLILVSNRFEDAIQLPNRAVSTLQPTLLYIQPYTAEEATRILRERMENALKPGTITDKLLHIIATAASEAEDIRLGFRTLLSAALLAEKNRKQRIELEDVKIALEGETRIKKLKKMDEIRQQLETLKDR
jgi:cell division control protein 6